MTIKIALYETIINSINVGNSIAEFDELLESARVETPVFNDILDDKYDFVLGRKGAGKTALFKIIIYLSRMLLGRQNLVLLSGVNASGESIFNHFKKQFSKFDESDFENFWKIYFISLIYNEFIKNPDFDAKLSECKDEIKRFISECSGAGIPDLPQNRDRGKQIGWIIDNIKKIRGSLITTYDPKTLNLFSLTPQLEVEFKEKAKTQKEGESIYINNIGKILKEILEKSKFKIWIILDRLDEVFDRYSDIEFKGLRGLLKAYKSFDIGADNNLFRIKIFLRDDIKSFLTDDKVYKKYFHKKDIPPLAAATHIFSKESPTLTWTEDEIEQLILNRLLLRRTPLWDYLNIREKYKNFKDREIEEKLKTSLKEKNERQKYWDLIFPKKISSSASLKWIYTRLKDSNDVVTPRTVIDMLEAATNYQKKYIQTNYSDSQVIYPVESLQAGLLTASKNKLEKDIFNEFPKEQQFIKKLSQFGEVKLNKKQLQKVFGKDWSNIVDTLRRIGFLRYIKNSDEYRIEFLFRPGLNLAYKY